MTMDPDVQLAANGDVEAFERIYRRHHSRVYTLCLRMVRNASQAEDLTQEVFIQLHRKLHTFRGDALLTTWLHRLTVNQVLMHFRKPIVKSEFTTDDEATLVPVASGTERPDRMAVIDRIGQHDRELGEHLRRMAEDLQYKDLLDLLHGLKERRIV